MTVLWVSIVILLVLALSGIALLFVKNSNATMVLSKTDYRIGILAGFFIISVSVFLYKQLGAYAAVREWQWSEVHAADIQNLKESLKTPEQVIARLQQELEQHPNSAEGWSLLGKLYLHIKQPKVAASALERAVMLDPNNADFRHTYLEVLFWLENDRLGAVAQEQIRWLLQQNPKDVIAINLLAIEAYQQKRYAAALQYWESIVNEISPESAEYQSLLRAIAKAQKHLRKAS